MCASGSLPRVTAPGPTTWRVVLGRILRQLREQAGMDRDAVATHLGSNASKVSRIEQGTATLKVTEVDGLLDLYGAGEDAATEAREAAAHARKRGSFGKVPDWSRQYLGLEADAAELRIHHGELVPGLMQTEDYARALVATSVLVATADVDRVVASRLRRQALLTRSEPPRLHLVLGEGVLHRVVGGPEVMRTQLDRLIELAEQPHVTLQVLPFAAGEHAAQGVDFTLLTLDIGNGSTTWAYVEQLTRADLSPDSGHVRPYTLTFESLTVNALGERETLTRLKQARDGVK
jgi:transcriptional regulator with XRE-family HTH domain